MSRAPRRTRPVLLLLVLATAVAGLLVGPPSASAQRPETTTAPAETSAALAAAAAPLAAPGENLLTNGDLEAGGDVPTCFTQYGWGTHDVQWSITDQAHSGTRAQRVTLSGYASGDRKMMQSPAAGCAPVVTPGERYDLSVFYTSTTARTGITLFTHSAAGWTYWTDLGQLPAAGTWTQAKATTPAIPAGVDQLMWGVSISGDGTLTTDDYVMAAQVAEPPPPPPPAGELIVNGDLEAGAAAPACFASGGWGTHTATQGFTAGRTGRGWEFTIAGYVDGDRKLLMSETAECAPAVQPNKTYELSAWYTSTTASASLTVFRHTAAGWQYWTDLGALPASAAWAEATAVVQIPADTDRIAWGISLHGDGTLRTDDYSMREQVITGPAGPLTETGRWTVLDTQLPLRAIHSTLLRDGRVLLVAGSGNENAQFAAGTFRSVIWDPSDNSFDEVPTPYDMFCSGHLVLPDGRVLVVGGTLDYPEAGGGPTTFRGSDASYVFDPTTDAFTATGNMAGAHWYPTLTRLENGDVWAAGGLDEKAEGTVVTEIFDTSEQRWLGLGEVPQTWSYWGTYPHMYLMEDGRLFYSGSHTFGNGLPGTGASIYDWRAAAITDVPGLRNKDLRDQAGSVMLPPAQDQRVMIVGGGNTDANAPAINSVDVIDLNAPQPAYTAAPNLPGPGKGYVNTTVLPDRTVLAANGARYNRAENVLTAAIYNPPTNAWRSVAPDPIGRNYHSTSLLLPDGRVAVFGSNPADNSFDLRISVYEPPYLFKGVRPQVTAAPQALAYGQAFNLGVTGTVRSASLVSPMSVTHQTDPNARLVDLPIAGGGANRLATVPDNPALLPPGPYMLTVLDSRGVPSVARWVVVG